MRKLGFFKPKLVNYFCTSQNAYTNGKNIKHQNYLRFLQDPSKVQSLDETRTLHALSITLGSIPEQSPVFVHNNIMSKYASFGDIQAAQGVFDEMPQKNVVSYNTMIGAYSRHGFLDEAWDLFYEMRKWGLMPTQFTIGGLLSCDELRVIQGLQLHALIVKNGLFYADPFAGTALLGMLGRNGYLDEAIEVFECMPKKSLVTCNCMISIFAQMGLIGECISLFRGLIRCETGLSEYTLVGVISAFEGKLYLKPGEQMHGLVIKYGSHYITSVANSLINMYAKCSETYLAEKLFDEVPVKDIVSWNTIIGAIANNNRPANVLEVFMRMSDIGLLPNETTLVNILRSWTSLQIPSYGEFIHSKMIKLGFQHYVYPGTALVDLYAKCNKLKEAHLCFEEITKKNLVSWNSLMLGYSNSGSSVSLKLLQEMIQSDHSPNEFSFSIVTKSASTMELLQLHSLIIKMGYIDNPYVLSSLITSYAKNGLISHALTFVQGDTMPLSVVHTNVIAGIYNRMGQHDKAQELFAALEEPDTVSWNILIAACSWNGNYSEAFELFHHMRISEVHPDNYTYTSLFSVCSKLCKLALGSSLHGLIIKTDFTFCDTFVRNIMIDMYGKCGSLQNAVKVFNEMTHKNVISWTALISSLGLHGYGYEALEKFHEMEIVGFMPDKVAFMAVLSACRHVGLVNQGMELFEQMEPKYGVKREMDHYHIVVDLLARHGHIKEAEQLILGMPFPPNALIWRCFLDGCKKQRASEDLALVGN